MKDTCSSRTPAFACVGVMRTTRSKCMDITITFNIISIFNISLMVLPIEVFQLYLQIV